MFNIEPSELLLLAAVALVVIGPKDLPKAMRFVGQWVGRARGMARHFRSGIDEIIRQAELDEMQQKWAAENARIMAEHSATPPIEEAHDATLALAGPAASASEPVVDAPVASEPTIDHDHLRALAASVEPEPAYAPGHPLHVPPAVEPPAEPAEPLLPLDVPHHAQGERG
ncbi:Sec-independent protein translocase protein TatB [Sphingomonas nostoxanthinifaciens]|uniref:Sec-independent protein translocase protein TatB n=1 Tax=Sphingomonas nostoxanthinifaciens TaxID=2872652 RepID=UPI001CC1E19B|nr:Sec-independent protein translocase protein TatB [Sphingomonas nostoxanthinifaciens]UAK24707.1 Sec-independent protein translocase protein TatB [Sphingomonas nostoxanthinifaciens]